MNNKWTMIFLIPALFIALPYSLAKLLIATSNATFNGHQLVTVILVVSIVPFGIMLFAFVDYVIFRVQWRYTYFKKKNKIKK